MAAEVAYSDLDFALSEKSESVLQAVIKEKKATTTQQDELFADIDGPTFDCTAFVNKLLPNPASLEKLPEYLGRLDIQIEALDKEIRSGIHEAACSRARTKSTLSKTREVVSELFTKINTISTKCQKSQQLVADICSDIRVLDTAKKNLTSTITALKRLHMLSSAASQLKTASNQRDFARAANLLEAVQALEIHFSNVKDVAKLTELTKKTQECRDSLRAAVFEVFGAAGAGAVENRKLLGEACSVVAVLGIECRTALIESVIRRQLEPYKVIFTPSEISGSGQVEDACFENTDRRYAWFKRQIRIFSERFRGIYPKGWNVAGLLALEFCSITNQHLKILLKNISREDVPDVALIVKVLTQTITFEKDLQRHYSNETPESTDNEDSESSIDNQKASDHEDSFRSHFKSVGTSRMEVLNEVTRVHFFGVISSCFQPFMGYYVTLEQQNMDELLKTLITTETWVLTEPITTSLQRYKGSDQIFLYIKNSMKRCLHLGQIELLTDVQQVYFAGLKNFCSLLESRSKELLISDTTSAPVAPPNASAIVSPVQDLTHLQLQSLGILINTAEYCSETLPQLQESISKAISQDIDCSSSQERFDALISKTIEDIISIMMLQSEKILTAMARLPLASLDAVGDTSQYVQQLKALFQDKTSSISAVLSPSYHHVFCNRLVANFLPKYMFSIIRCKRINDFGAQQLLLDTEALKTILLGLPSLGSDKQSDLDAAKKRPPKSYTTILLKQIGKTEAILKTLSASTDTLAETYSTLLPNGNQIDLIRIMDLKGIKKVDQQAVVKTYNNICPAQHQSEPLFKDDGSKKFYLF